MKNFCTTCGATLTMLGIQWVCNCLPLPPTCAPTTAQTEYCGVTPVRLDRDDEPTRRSPFIGGFDTTGSQGASGISVPLLNRALDGQPFAISGNTLRITPYPKSPEVPTPPEPIRLRIDKMRDG
jgi:hypothetical protein